MNPTERKVLKECTSNMDKLSQTEKNFVEFLADKDPSFRLKADYRNRLYAAGKKVGIDGKKEFSKKAKKQSGEG